MTGDVYRKDEIDARHYPIFHQMEGVCLTDNNPEEELKKVLSGLVEYLFPGKEYRFGNDYFPFTDPSFEIEVLFGDRWLEILGCGVIHHKILERLNIKQKGWAFGLGLERFAMILFDIPDIRLFWSNDKRFINQFKDEKIVTFKPYSKIEPLTKDISFWINENEIKQPFEWLKINDFYEQVREICGDSIESVSILDQFYHEKHKKYSMTFRLVISSYDYNHAKVTEYVHTTIKKIAENLTASGYVLR